MAQGNVTQSTGHNYTTSSTALKYRTKNSGNPLAHDDVDANFDILRKAVNGLVSDHGTQASQITAINQVVTELGTSITNITNGSTALPMTNITGLSAALAGKIDDNQVLTNVPANAVFTDTAYSLPVAATAIGGVKEGGDIDIDGNGLMTLAPGAVSSTSLPIALGGGLTFDANGKLKLDISDSGSSFRMYVNANTGVAHSAIDPEQISAVSGKNEFAQKFATISDAISWISNNVSSDQGHSHIVLETNITQGPIYTPPGGQELSIWGNKAAYQRQMGISSTNPTSSETRKTITITSATSLNNVPVYLAASTTLYLCIFNITVNANQYAWYRGVGRGNFYDILGCKFVITHNNIAVAHGFQIQGANLRVRPFQANWRTGLARLDPFHHGSSYRLAPIEITNCRAYSLFAAGDTGRISIIEYQYANYGSSGYTYDARVHFTNSATIWIFCYLEGACTFETNGACATLSSGATITVNEASIKAVAFCPILPQQTQASGNIGGPGVWPVLPGGGYSGTVNVDYRIKSGTSLSFTNNLNGQNNYPS